PLLRNDHLHFVCLQYGDRKAEIDSPGAQGISITVDPTFDQLTDLDSFAAQVASLDLVITIDNSTAHMAGALGVPCWVLIPHPAEWRWMLDREDCIWWPYLRLFRQRERNDWSAPLARVQEELARWASEKRKLAAAPDPHRVTITTLEDEAATGQRY